jgi:hypothetical protein
MGRIGLVSDNNCYILGQYTVPATNSVNSFTFGSIPTEYDLIEIHVAGSFTKDQDSGATGQVQYLSCEIQDTWDTSSTGYTADVSRMYMSAYGSWYGQSKYGYAWRGSDSNPIYSGYVPISPDNNIADTYNKAFGVRMQLMGPNSQCPKQVYFAGTMGDNHISSNARFFNGAFGLDIQRNSTVRDWGKGPWRSMKMRLTNYGTYSASTSPTFVEGTEFTMLGYKGLGLGW